MLCQQWDYKHVLKVLGYGGFDQSLQSNVSNELSVMELFNCSFYLSWEWLQGTTTVWRDEVESHTASGCYIFVFAPCLKPCWLSWKGLGAKDHGLSPRLEHYTCVINLLGWVGLLSEGKQFIVGLSDHPGIDVWQALLGACSIHGDSKMGKYATDKLFLAEPESPAPYILLSSIYSSEGRWKERARTIKRTREMGV